MIRDSARSAAAERERRPGQADVRAVANCRSARALSHDDLAAAVATIRAFSDADLNVAKAAQQLHVHPNTVRYRLQQIAARTGHDPRTFTGLVDLICILTA